MHKSEILNIIIFSEQIVLNAVFKILNVQILIIMRFGSEKILNTYLNFKETPQIK